MANMAKQWLKTLSINILWLGLVSEISGLAALQPGVLLVLTDESHYHRRGGRYPAICH
ncbi:hypothetical protein SGGMMB4_05127 [Sodalis glossinidius str. 'morsitans']|uniref:Uncharacterized protein n=1 Tax=Sodalis glossinidius (strain morsitans) TaxID=343509 RepID=A0A193QMS2_SODGM|nr:hypothetical protein SGGMMB4_05127 [Sodalis glossinidius str. 'morsitans']